MRMAAPSEQKLLNFVNVRFTASILLSPQVDCVHISFMVINHSGISFLLANSSESVQNVAVVQHQLTSSWGINVLRLRACMTLTWQQH